MINLLKIKVTRKFLTKEAYAKLTISLVISHLDYAHSLLVGLPQVSLDQLQRVQNIVAEIVLNKSKYDSSTKCLEQLQWLPIQQCILCKVITLVFKCIHGQAASYLQKLNVLKQSRKQGMRSDKETRILEIPCATKKTHAARSFSLEGPEQLNRLPDDLRRIEDCKKFKSKLKMHLYKKAF